MPDKLRDTLASRAKIGPFKGRLLDERDQGAELRPGMKGTFVDEQPRDIPSMGQLLNRLQELGAIPGLSDVSPVNQAVAAVKPKYIPFLKQKGIDLIKDVRTLPTFQGFKPEAVSALTQAQSMFPRVFGHLGAIRPKIATESIKGLPRDKKIAGLFAPGYGKAGGEIELNPDVNVDPAKVVAHELTHAAQTIGSGGGLRFDKKYREALDEVGYWDNPLEVGARKAEGKFRKGPRKNQPSND